MSTHRHSSAYEHFLMQPQAAEDGELSANDPLRVSTLNGAQTIREDLRRQLGTDLTVEDKTNPLFHTGGAPNAADATDVLSHRPAEFLWRVAEGRSTGVGRTKPEAWHAFVDRMLKENFHTRDRFTRIGGNLPPTQYGAADHQYH